MSGMTPGQAMYEGAIAEARKQGTESVFPDWADLEDWQRKRHDAGAQAVLNQAFPGLRKEIAELKADRDQLRQALRRIALGNAGDPSVAADNALVASRANREKFKGLLPTAVPQASPELAAAIAETKAIRERYKRVLDRFASSGDGWRSRVSGVILAREYRDAGLPVPERLGHLEGQ